MDVKNKKEDNFIESIFDLFGLLWVGSIILLPMCLILIGIGGYIYCAGYAVSKLVALCLSMPTLSLSLLSGFLIWLVAIAIYENVPNPVRRYVSSRSRLALPKCPECDDGRLITTEKEIRTYDRQGGAGKLYYGMRSFTECTDFKRTISCDRCDYTTSEEYTKEGAVSIC